MPIRRVKLRNVTAQHQELPAPGRPRVAPGAVYEDWVDFSDSVERVLAQGRVIVVDEFVVEPSVAALQLPKKAKAEIKADDEAKVKAPKKAKKASRTRAKKDG